MKVISHKYDIGDTVFVVTRANEQPAIKEFTIGCITIEPNKQGERRISYAPGRFTFEPYAESACYPSREALISAIGSVPVSPYTTDIDE